MKTTQHLDQISIEIPTEKTDDNRTVINKSDRHDAVHPWTKGEKEQARKEYLEFLERELKAINESPEFAPMKKRNDGVPYTKEQVEKVRTEYKEWLMRKIKEVDPKRKESERINEEFTKSLKEYNEQIHRRREQEKKETLEIQKAMETHWKEQRAREIEKQKAKQEYLERKRKEDQEFTDKAWYSDLMYRKAKREAPEREFMPQIWRKLYPYLVED